MFAAKKSAKKDPNNTAKIFKDRFFIMLNF